jgi:D-alanyl-D-alanine dipeptidase
MDSTMTPLALALTAFFCGRADEPVVPDETLQLVVGLAPAWNARTAVIYRFERRRGGKWRRLGAPWDANIGKNGLAAGDGLIPVCAPEGQHKVEGDKKAPAGVFTLGPIYGFGNGYRKAPRGRMRKLNDTMACIEDPASRHYNRIVDTAKVASDWEWSRPIKKPDAIMSRMIVVGHNGGSDPDAVTPAPDHGSCIFFHIARGPDRPTVGCTSLPEKRLDAIIRWLTPKKHPVYILLTADQYRHLSHQPKSRLPRIR